MENKMEHDDFDFAKLETNVEHIKETVGRIEGAIFGNGNGNMGLKTKVGIIFFTLTVVVLPSLSALAYFYVFK